jgi:hypothetical protein
VRVDLTVICQSSVPESLCSQEGAISEMIPAPSGNYKHTLCNEALLENFLLPREKKAVYVFSFFDRLSIAAFDVLPTCIIIEDSALLPVPV